MVTTDELRPPGDEAKIASLLALRAARLRAVRKQDEEDTGTLAVALFRLGGLSCAMALDTLRAAMPLRLVAPIPLAPRDVLGVVRFEGQLITVLSLASLLGMSWSLDPTVLLVVETGRGDHLVALDCEDVPRPDRISAAALEDARDRDPSASIVPVATPHLGLVHVIDVGRLVGARPRDREDTRAG